MTDLTAARNTMVSNQLRTYDVLDFKVLNAFEMVPREAFVAESEAALAYLDREVLARGGKTRLLTPMVLARMVQSLEVLPGETALDVNGSGYGAAILAACGARVTALETDADGASAALKAAGVSGVEVISGEAGAGAPGKGPFNVILVHGAAEVEPEALLDQLADRGRLMIVMGRGRSGRAMLFRKVGNSASGVRVIDAAAPAISSLARASEFAF
ncbi:MAG: protein-L-isoaspartate O-methyltransferase [Proteobacteria bacterium]|nr:protein-L-isoaspartate O-methyltransferase [Pseudomonadota bacterium]